MDVSIGRVVELVCPDDASGFPTRALLRQSARVADIVVGMSVRHGVDLDQLGAEQPDRVLLFLALCSWDDDAGPVSESGADHGEANAGVAGGAFHDQAPRLQLTARLGVTDDAQSRPVLHRLSGIEELRLAQDLTSREFAGALQSDQGRFADGLDNRCCSHAKAPFCIWHP